MTNIIIPTKITNNSELLEAQAIRSKLKEQLKAIEEQKEKVSRPLLDAIAARRAEFAPTIKKYEEEIAKVDKALKDYQNSILALKKQEEQRILEDKRLKPETVITKLTTVEPVSTKGFRKHQVLKITDPTQIPQEYLLIDEKRLFNDLKAGKTVKGAEIEIELLPTE